MKSFFCTVPLIFTAVSGGALATGGADDGSASRELPSIYVDGILPDDIRLTPGAASSLTSAEMEQLRAYSLHDLFDFIPGVRTIDDDILGRRTAIGIRGAPPRRSRKTLLLEDGTPINFSSYLDASAHYSPPAERLQSVDVLKGAGHVFHGPLNNHGIINFRNKKATPEAQTQIDLALGSLSTFKRHILHSRTDGNFGTVFSYTGANADGSFDIEEFQFDDFYASLDWAIDERQDIGVSLTWYQERSNYDESNLTPQEYVLAPDRKSGRFEQQYNTFALDYLKADAVHNLQITPQLMISTRVFATDADRPRFTVDPGDIAVDALPEFVLLEPDLLFIPGAQGEMVGRIRYYRTYGLESRMEYSGLQWSELEHTLQWGIRSERHLLDDKRSAGKTGELLDVDNRGLKTRDVMYQASAVSAYVQDIVQAGNWTVTPGLRAEYYTQTRQRRNIVTDPGPHAPQVKDYNGLLLPSVSVLYTGLQDTQIFANIARGYTPAPARTAEEFPLKPETGINSQLGLRSNSIAGFSVEGAIFFNRITDTVVQLPFSENGVNVVLNSADSRSYGFDLGLQFDTDRGQSLAQNFFVQLAWNYTRAEFTENFGASPIKGNRVPEIPMHSGSFTVGLQSESGWLVSASLSHFGKFYTDPLNTKALVLADEDREPVGPGARLEIREPAVLGSVDSHSLLSARASYQFPNRDLQVWMQGRNLADKKYITDLENGIRPGARRTIVAGIKVGF